MKHLIYLMLFISSACVAGSSQTPRRLFASQAPQASENPETNSRAISAKKEKTAQCSIAMASILARMQQLTAKDPQDLTDEEADSLTEDLARIARNVERCRRWGVIQPSEIEQELQAKVDELERRKQGTPTYVRPPIYSIDNPLWVGAASAAGGVALGVAATLAYLKR